MNRNEIWVICYNLQCSKTHIFQLVNKAYDLSCINKAHVTAVYIGKNDEEALKSLLQNGADKVLYAEYEEDEQIEIADILKQMISEYVPEMIMFLGNNTGKYLAAVCSTAFQAGLTADCVDISVLDDGDYVFSRAALNDSVIASIKAINCNTKMCTVKNNTFYLKNYNFNKPTHIEKFEYRLLSKKRPHDQILEKKKSTVTMDDINWQSSKLVFAVGRGVLSKQNMEKIKILAVRYGAQVVGTRAAVEEGLIEQKRQVGQSGYSICPDVYVGFGVSGACQHIVGIKNAKQIIAINKDQKAPIFDYADYKIIDTVESIIEEWMKLK
ncbi:electron transfer flavoprotein subunit alpha/FixB family protein [Clostridium felsineum]|uniref:electron transfer flavoprotein subunit alpha/FixB family protein n=1 Tax=Clostridium felsineum TaxID=36839 RepID=UPI0009C6F9B3|nr:electron transfer flavoprotein subunit alpha/FixB family protein [Clostridium felsineum]URZ01268.1 Caffeyl-CoA reductase-Etf complex subunit CarE [Clostridium felsineum]